MTLYSDASRFAWGGSFHGAFPRCISDYWDHSSICYDITVKETLALANVLSSVKDSIQDSRVDVFVDSQALISAWERQGSRSPALFRALKQVFVVSSPLNVDLRLFYIPSVDNIADLPSRRISRQDAMLSSPLWDSVQSVFGRLNGHSVDLMALPSNVQHGLDGSPLPFFAPFPVPGCSGVNLFAQEFLNIMMVFFQICTFFPLLLSSLLFFAFFRALACHLLLLLRTFPQGNTGGLFCVLQLVILFFLLQKGLWALSLFHLKRGFPPIGLFPGIFGFLGYAPLSLFKG